MPNGVECPALSLCHNRVCRTLCPARCPALSCAVLRSPFAITGCAGQCVLQGVLRCPAVPLCHNRLLCVITGTLMNRMTTCIGKINREGLDISKIRKFWLPDWISISISKVSCAVLRYAPQRLQRCLRRAGHQHRSKNTINTEGV